MDPHDGGVPGSVGGLVDIRLDFAFAGDLVGNSLGPGKRLGTAEVRHERRGRTASHQPQEVAAIDLIHGHGPHRSAFPVIGRVFVRVALAVAAVLARIHDKRKLPQLHSARLT
jgi:hypothetical protein